MFKKNISNLGFWRQAIVTADGILQYATSTNMKIGRSVEETLRVLHGLQSGGLCPSDWKPGQRTLE